MTTCTAVKRFDNDRESERHPESGQIHGRLRQSGDDGRQIRPLDRHHQPGPGQWGPEREDASVGQDSGRISGLGQQMRLDLD